MTSPLNILTLSEAGGCAGATAQAGEHLANDDKCVDLGGVCVPLVTETYRAWGPEASASFSQLASRLAIRLQRPKSVLLHELYSRLNTCLIQCVSLAISSPRNCFQLPVFVSLVSVCTINCIQEVDKTLLTNVAKYSMVLKE